MCFQCNTVCSLQMEPINRITIQTHKSYELKFHKTFVRRLPEPFPSNCTRDVSKSIFPGKATKRYVKYEVCSQGRGIFNRTFTWHSDHCLTHFHFEILNCSWACPAPARSNVGGPRCAVATWVKYFYHHLSFPIDFLNVFYLYIILQWAK